MKPLEFPFLKNGFTHELLERRGRVCLVRRHKEGGRSPNLEVVVLRVRKASTFRVGGREIHSPEHESYPSNEDWGTYGWTFRAGDLAKAKAKMASLVSMLAKAAKDRL